MRLTEIEIEWAGGTHKFDLKLGNVRALQEKTGIGPGVIHERLIAGQWKVDDYRETILQGLLGAGMAAPEASKLVRTWVDERPAKESLLPAQAIILSFIMGAPPAKKAPALKKKKKTTARAGSTSGRSTEPALP